VTLLLTNFKPLASPIAAPQTLEVPESKVTQELLDKFRKRLVELKLNNIMFDKIIQIYEEAR
jgi:hypothetical protein